ncbi:ROK family protein [Corynebacterium sp. CCM 8862]|uniref:ROK family protein n=2 Tax=Corynebacterium mendelii TaxID=2765362 RepID=A0A939DZU1_9CORY|nr:ROK family protein [Corynebacterium mendelii]
MTVERACMLAVDLGGTKIAGGYIDPEQPTVVHGRTQQPTLAMDGPATVIEQLSKVLAELIASAEQAGYTPAAVGLGSPGVINPDTGMVVNVGQTMPGWAGTNVKAAMTTITGLPAAVHNDVRVMGLGEAVYGAGKGFADVLFVSIGTGIGGAVVRNGALDPSPHHSRGEIAYLACPQPEGNCDIIENAGSGPALAKRYRQRKGITDPSVDLREVMRRWYDGDQTAKDVIAESMECTGRGLAGYVNALDVSAVVIGGGVATIGEPIIAPLEKAFRADLLDGMDDMVVTTTEFGTDAPLIGAACLAGTALEHTSPK